MATPKSEKIRDVKKPEKVAAQPTSRPIIVTNHTMMTSDPMVVAAADTAKTAPEVGKTAVVSRAEKVIKPMNDITVDVAETPKKAEDIAEKPEPTEPAATTAEASNSKSDLPEVPVAEPEKAAVEVASAETAKSEPAAETVEAVDAKPAEEVAIETPAPPKAESESDQTVQQVTAESESSSASTEPKRDSVAEQANAEAEAQNAQSEREQELALLIASGKYNVPINAVQRKRSRIHIAVLSTFALLAALILLDAALDAGFVSLPIDVPHTNFFSQQ